MHRPRKNSVTNRASTLYSEVLRVMMRRMEQKNSAPKTSTPVNTTKHVSDVHFNGTCVYCGMNEANTLDHVVSIVCKGKLSGYGNSPDNLVPCCSSCNSSKGSRPWKQWMFDKFGECKDTQYRAAYITSLILNARKHDLNVEDESLTLMYDSLKKRCYVVCSLLHDLSTQCGDSPSGWRDHVSLFDQSIMLVAATGSYGESMKNTQLDKEGTEQTLDEITVSSPDSFSSDESCASPIDP